jgi:hypothetical protein
LALNVVLLQTALRLELRGKPTLRGHRKSVIRDPYGTWQFRICAAQIGSLNPISSIVNP